jgi:hypothetical protein
MLLKTQPGMAPGAEPESCPKLMTLPLEAGASLGELCHNAGEQGLASRWHWSDGPAPVLIKNQPPGLACFWRRTPDRVQHQQGRVGAGTEGGGGLDPGDGRCQTIRTGRSDVGDSRRYHRGALSSRFSSKPMDTILIPFSHLLYRPATGDARVVWVRFLPPLESGTASWLRWLRLRSAMTCPRPKRPALI